MMRWKCWTIYETSKFMYIIASILLEKILYKTVLGGHLVDKILQDIYTSKNTTAFRNVLSKTVHSVLHRKVSVCS